MDESWTLVINLAKTDTYILVQKSMLHLFPLISARRLNPQTHEHTNTRTNIFGLLYWLAGNPAYGQVARSRVEVRALPLRR